MKKIVMLILVSCFAVSAAQACPKGTHPVGGAGTHHKGGTCR